MAKTVSGDHLDDLVGKVVEEYFERVERGERPQLEEFVEQYPEISDLLKTVIPALQATERSDASTNGTEGTEHHRQLGDFHILRQIGRGGMGIVYEAEQISIKRRVALKVLPLAGLVDDTKIRRFQNEVRAVAALDHPNIVSVYMVGEERGVHYYAMQLIRGRSLSEVISSLRRVQNEGEQLNAASMSQVTRIGGADNDAKAEDAEPNLDTVTVDAGGYQHGADARSAKTVDEGESSTIPHSSRREYFRSVVALGIQAASALQHAHDEGIVHRDIKPANLMLDSASKLYVTDFGLARIEADAGVTMTGDLIGTLRYMAPEQALAKRVVVDHRADIYSLAATLYELLALRPVYLAEDRQQLLKQIAFEDPTPLRRIDREIPAELETIIHKAMSKDMDQRYASAQELADDLRAHVDNRPIKAKPPTTAEIIGKWTQRNPAWTWAAIITLFLVSVTLAGSSFLVLRQRNIARYQASVATVAGKEAEAARGRESALREEAQKEERRQRQIAYSADMKLGREYLKKHNRAGVEEILERYAGEDDLRDVEWRHLQWTGEGDETDTFPHETEVRGISLSADGARLASITMSGKVRLLDVGTHTILQQHGGGNMSSGVQDGSVALSPNGRYLAADQQGILTVWSTDNSAVMLEAPNVAAPVCFSPDSQYLAGVTEEGLRIWKTANWHKSELLETSLEIGTSHLRSLAFTPDSSRVIISPSRFASRLIVYNLANDATEGELTGLTCPHVISTDGSIVAAGGRDGQVCVWHLENRDIISTFKAHSSIVVAVALSPDGKTLATGGNDSEIRLWDTQAFETIGVLKGHHSQVWNLKFSGNGRYLASASMDRSAKLWDWQRKNQILRATVTVNDQDPESELTNTEIRESPGSAEGGNPRRAPRIHTVTPGESIQAAVDAAMPGDRIDIAAGLHEISETIDVNKPLIIRGEATNRDDAGPFPTILKGAEGLSWVMHLETEVGTVAEILDLQIETSGSGIQHLSGDFTLRRCQVIVRSVLDFQKVISLESMGIENHPTDTVTIDGCTLSAEYIGDTPEHTPPDVDIVLAGPGTRYVEITVTKSGVTNEIPNAISNGIETRSTTAHLTIDDNRIRCQGMGIVLPNHIGTMDIRNNTIWSTFVGITAGTESPKRSSIIGNHITIDEQKLQVYPLFVREYIAISNSACIKIGSTSAGVAAAFFKNKAVIGRGTNFWVEQNELTGNPKHGIALVDSPEPESYGPPTPNDSHDNIIARNDFTDLNAEWDIALGSSTFDNLIVDNVEVDGIFTEAGDDDRNVINAD